MAEKFNYKLGWIPDYPDIRDYTVKHLDIKRMATKLTLPKSSSTSSKADLRLFCSTIENQGNIGSCTAHAVAGVVEYFESKAFGKHMEASRLFLYKVTRNLSHSTGDTGAFLRTALGALVLFGVPPEEFWPYIEKDFDKEPNAFCYAYGQSYRCINYFRHDPKNTPLKDVLISIKKYASGGIPSVFGFTVYASISQATRDGCIPFPGQKEKVLGGHAVAIFGYDDEKVITNSSTGKSTTGALLIRNSWGEEWGENGYGWIPYEYVLQGIAQDFWSILKQDWIDAEGFMES